MVFYGNNYFERRVKKAEVQNAVRKEVKVSPRSFKQEGGGPIYSRAMVIN